MFAFKDKENKKIGKYKKLVLAGGGLKGLAYVGAISALRRYKILDNIDEIVGCSIGAIFALLINLGYTDYELHDFLLHFQYKEFKDIDFFKIVTEWGVESGQKIELYLIKLIKDKTGLEDPTFIELYNKTRIGLIINAVALDSYMLYYFNHISSPDIKVVKAIRASIAVPGLFTPVRLNKHLFVDGGLLNNFPIDYFKAKKIPANIILGICFNSNTEPPGYSNITSINTYLTAIIGCILDRIDKTGVNKKKLLYNHDFPEHQPKVITIETGNIGTLQSTLDRTMRLFLYHNGEQAVLNSFKDMKNSNYSNKITYGRVNFSKITYGKATSKTKNNLRRNSI